MTEWTWNSNRIGMIIDKIKYDDQLFDCHVMYSDGSLRESRLPHKLIYPNSSLDIVISSMEFYRDYCLSPNYAPIFWKYDPIEWTFDSNDGNALVIARNQIDTDYEDHDFDLFKCVVINSEGLVERSIFRMRYQLSRLETTINRMSESKHKSLKTSQHLEKQIMNAGIDFLSKVLRRK